MCACVHVFACVCVRACACVCVHVCVRARVRVYKIMDSVRILRLYNLTVNIILICMFNVDCYNGPKVLFYAF